MAWAKRHWVAIVLVIMFTYFIVHAILVSLFISKAINWFSDPHHIGHFIKQVKESAR